MAANGMRIDIGPCERLRLVGTHGLDITLDGEEILLARDYSFRTAAAAPGASGIGPLVTAAAGGSLDATGLKAWKMNHGFDITIERPARELVMRPDPDDTFLFLADEMPGAVYIFVANGPATMDWGSPISHTVRRNVLGASTDLVIEPIRPTLHGDNAGTNPNGSDMWVPARTEITGIAVEADPIGGNAFLSLDLEQIVTGAVRFRLGRWVFDRRRVATDPSLWDIECHTPIEIYNHMTREFIGGNQGALRCVVSSSAEMTEATVTLRCRSWM